ncbi:MAG: DUF4886 domain-containing protein [Chthoniobacterales bacterium]|nr:DUF4886 domain-containing protein [Chthoniobacterales bacterium]
MKSLLAFLLIAVLPGAFAEESPGKPLRLLTVGNSFAYNATAFLPALAQAAGQKIEIGAANFGGCSLEKHWSGVELAEAGDPKGAFYPAHQKNGPKRALKDFLADGPWDIITIQQASRLSGDYSTFQPYASQLVAYLRKHAPNAEIVIHQTWAYRRDDPIFKDGNNPEKMHAALQAAYRRLATDLNLRLVPVGEAFALATRQSEWDGQPPLDVDRAAYVFPKVPDQPPSLQAGWTWVEKPDGPKFYLDTHHASLFGKYLGACVFFEFLFGGTVVGNPFVPEGMTLEQAASLQKIAHEAIAANPSKPAATLP